MIKLTDGTIKLNNINYIINDGGCIYLHTKDYCKYCISKDELAEIEEKLYSKN